MFEKMLEDAAAAGRAVEWQLLVELLDTVDLLQQQLVKDRNTSLENHETIEQMIDRTIDAANEAGYDIA